MYILTGGAGFIGSNILKALNERGVSDVIVVDNLTRNEKFKNIVGLHFNDYIDKTDFINYINEGKIKKITAIIHHGACSDTTESNGKYMMDNNYSYSRNIAEYSIAHDIPFIYASSASVYGIGESGFTESFQCEAPINIYAYSKYLFDQWVRKHLHEVSSTFVGLRYFNVYGPNEYHKGKMSSMVFQAYEQIKTAKKIKLFKGYGNIKDGEQSRDFIFIDDVVSIVMFFIDSPFRKGIFNIGTGKSRSFNELARILIDCYGAGEIEYIPFPDELKGKYQNYTQAELGALMSAGYDNKFTSLEYGIKKYVEILIGENKKNGNQNV
ncbi:MAG: ADP-glyceromanno-heptose 6-epimerase [Synergistaceae bacterium]|nr:ADP-glyceromanno-heptose 6-epimerase [Synergistaceae bacterium]